MIIKVISLVAYIVGLSPRYRWLHLVFHALWLKPHISPVPDTEQPLVILANDFVENEYEFEQVLDI